MPTPKIAIQKVGEDAITINVDGEIRQIQNQLAELKKLLQELDVQNVQYAEKIYNIEHINEANFGFVTGKKAFNEALTKAIIEAIKDHCVPAQKFYSRVKDIANWEQQARISDKAKEIIAYSFVGVVGIQLSKLMAIGKEAFSDTKQHKYIKKCITIVKRSLDLVNFTLISKLWDIQKAKSITFSETEQNALRQFFDRNFEQSVAEQFELLSTLQALFSNHNIAPPFAELDFPKHQNALKEVCTTIQELNQNLDRGEYSLVDCFTAETQLATLFQAFNFLVQYNMASIKRIGYKQVRHANPRYLHRFAALGIDSKANVDAEKVAYTPDTVNTDAVLVYKGQDYKENINLFPLVIDYNALTFEHGVKICFYQGKDIADGSLEFRFLEDESTIHVESQGIVKEDTDYNQLMLKEESQIALNLEQVVIAFEEARRTLLSDDVFLDDL